MGAGHGNDRAWALESVAQFRDHVQRLRVTAGIRG